MKYLARFGVIEGEYHFKTTKEIEAESDMSAKRKAIGLALDFRESKEGIFPFSNYSQLCKTKNLCVDSPESYAAYCEMINKQIIYEVNKID